MNRLFTQAEVDEFLPLCHAYASSEFGEEDCVPISRLRSYRSHGVHFYQPYGDFSTSPPTILGVAHCFLTSESELEALHGSGKLETELDPWRPEDGPAVFWVSGVVSDMPGVAAKCIAGALDLVDASPFKQYIRKAAVICTGPQGYLMSQAFGMLPDGMTYREGWPFMERDIMPDELGSLSKSLQSIWSMTKARDVIRTARTRWGQGWRDNILR